MKKTWNYVNLTAILFVLSIGFIACHKDDPPAPAANFTVSTQSTSKGLAITFNNKSTHASNFLWKFGDGNGAVTKNPVYAYDSIGNFTVTLIALGTGGIDSTTLSIAISSGNITILDGVGIKDVNIGITWAEVKSKFGIVDTANYSHQFENCYANTVYYKNKNIAFVFYSTKKDLLPGDDAYIISLIYPFEGTTKKGIALGDPASYITSYYGKEEDKSSEDGYDSYVYYTSGIAFYADSYGIFEIDVFTPYSNTSGMITKAASHLYRANVMLMSRNIKRK
jgi:PKD repeat protein